VWSTPCDGGTTTLIVKRQLLSLGIKIKWSATVDAVAILNKRGEENQEKEKKKRQQSSMCSFFDFQLVHRWIGLRF
jgi:hypothetical protein